MSQQIVSQKVKRVCDGCGLVKEYDLITASEEEILDMASWFAVGRKAFGPDGRPFQMTLEAHALECVSVVAAKLLMPPADDSEEIDLASLRVGGPQVN